MVHHDTVKNIINCLRRYPADSTLNSFTHLPTDPHARSLIYRRRSLTHSPVSLGRSLARSLNHSFICSLDQSFAYTHSVSHVPVLTHPLNHSPTRSLTFTYPCTHSPSLRHALTH